MIVGTSRGAIDGYEPVQLPGLTAGRPGATMCRRRSPQPTRRAVLHVQAPDDPVAPTDLSGWFTERAFHFYLAGLRLPGPAGRGTRQLGQAFVDLTAACAHLRQAEGMNHVILAAQGRGAVTAALWVDRHGNGHGTDEATSQRRAGADALILYAPDLAARPPLNLNIACPVLVLTTTGPAGAEPGRSLLGRPRRPVAAPQLGGHVTWLELPAAAGLAGRAGGPGQAGWDGPGRTPGRAAVFDELGRWLGAYMYGQVRDQLL